MEAQTEDRDAGTSLQVRSVCAQVSAALGFYGWVALSEVVVRRVARARRLDASWREGGLLDATLEAAQQPLSWFATGLWTCSAVALAMACWDGRATPAARPRATFMAASVLWWTLASLRLLQHGAYVVRSFTGGARPPGGPSPLFPVLAALTCLCTAAALADARRSRAPSALAGIALFTAGTLWHFNEPLLWRALPDHPPLAAEALVVTCGVLLTVLGAALIARGARPTERATDPARASGGVGWARSLLLARVAVALAAATAAYVLPVAPEGLLVIVAAQALAQVGLTAALIAAVGRFAAAQNGRPRVFARALQVWLGGALVAWWLAAASLARSPRDATDWARWAHSEQLAPLVTLGAVGLGVAALASATSSARAERTLSGAWATLALATLSAPVVAVAGVARSHPELREAGTQALAVGAVPGVIAIALLLRVLRLAQTRLGPGGAA